ncbi:histidinol-phosphate transaminase [Sodalis ligni]|uniref:Histidinol-phosphate aminotransferase n=1 Tax=Sodalis ligni TaxID=2697027 RepID=A0A4R1N7B4_9GAMM|nr:histidinol-phosphate transaminase [Sodalis ligni]TCL03174.1 histidinol-phosphate aminotransferase [Sodalis ligni]
MSADMIKSLARAEAIGLSIYNSGLSDQAVRQRFNVTHIARLASNENPLGASPDVVRAINLSAPESAVYPDPASLELREALARQCGMTADLVVMGNGSEDLLKLLCLAFVNPGDRVVTLLPSFGLHHIYPRMMGAEIAMVPVDPRMEYDLPGWERALNLPSKLVIFSNPSNPVGCMLDNDGFERLIAAAPADCLLVVDEAYYEYCADLADYPDSLTLLRNQPRPWIVLRTFSKAYGLAGLRIGYGLASDPAIVEILDRVRTPFNINRGAQAAALAALHDRRHVLRSVAHVRAQRGALRQALIAMGLTVAPSQANFLFFRVPGEGAAVAEKLLAYGVIVKPWLETGYRDWLRVSIGTETDQQIFLQALHEVLK